MGLTHDDAHTGVWAPAATELGWVIEHPCASMNLTRFTLHSLRDRLPRRAEQSIRRRLLLKGVRGANSPTLTERLGKALYFKFG
jgi:hypothetical protein